jgi:cell division protein FtsI (penicillin-binding protein 3)
VGLPNKSRDQLRKPQRWSLLSLPTMSIGQEVSVTALQIVAAFGAVANGGTLMQPRIVKAEFDADGRETRRFAPKAVRQVISPETAKTLGRMLTEVVADGTGHLAAVPGYEVGGKTGTAQKLDPQTRRYSRAPGVLSFVGFVPVDEPRLVMLVMLDEPRNEKWGSEAAAPIFAAIAAPVLRHLEILPRDAPPVQIVAGAPAESAAGGHGRTAAVAMEAAEAAAGVMPDLRGSTLRQALTALTPRGVRVEVAGRGRVVHQAPAPGDPLDADAVARLVLSRTVVRVAQRGPEPAREAVQ